MPLYTGLYATVYVFWDYFSPSDCMPLNLASLPASSLSQAECLVRARPTSPKAVVPSRVQKALLAERVRGGSLGHESSRVQLG